MKRFSVKYSPLVIALVVICLIIFIVGLVFSIFKIIDCFNYDLISSAIYFVLSILDILLIAFTFSLLIYGKYVIKKDKLYFNLGFIRTYYDISAIVEINLFKKTNKLVVYFEDLRYTVIIISPKSYDEFIRELRKINPQIVYEERKESEEIEK